MNGLVTIMKAADAAARWHVNQRRKGAAQEPYVTHLLEVAMLVAEATAGADPPEFMAAYQKVMAAKPVAAECVPLSLSISMTWLSTGDDACALLAAAAKL